MIFAFQPQVLVHNSLPLLMTHSSRAPMYHRVQQFSRPLREGNVSQYKTTFLFPWKSWSNKYFASSFAMEEKRHKPGFMHDASCTSSPMCCFSTHQTFMQPRFPAPRIAAHRWVGLNCTFTTLIRLLEPEETVIIAPSSFL